MRGLSLQRLDQVLRHSLPFVLTLLLILFESMPTRLPGFSTIAPSLPLISVFYWSVFRPDLMTPVPAFILGALADLVAGTPFGISSFVFLLTCGICGAQRRLFIGKPFLVAWSGFAIIATAALLLQYLLFCMMRGRFVMPNPILYELLMTVAIYPILSWILTRLQITLLRSA